MSSSFKLVFAVTVAASLALPSLSMRAYAQNANINAGQLEGSDVIGADGKKLCSIKEILFRPDNQDVQGYLAECSGPYMLGKKKIFIWAHESRLGFEGGRAKLYTGDTEEWIKKAPEVKLAWER
jgi:hypothetical protein